MSTIRPGLPCVQNTSFRPQSRGSAQVSQTEPKPKPKPKREFWAVSVLGAGIGAQHHPRDGVLQKGRAA